MIFVMDRNYNTYKTLDIDSAFIKEMNKLNVLEFSTDFEIPKGDYVVLKDDGKYYEFVVVDSEYRREDSYVYDYFCQDTLIETSGYVIEEERPTQNASQHLEFIFKPTGWEVVNKGDYTTGDAKVNYYRVNRLEAFKSVLEVFDIEWETNFIVNDGVITRRQLIFGKIGKKVNSRLEFEKNIKRFERKILPKPVYTALIGLGKGEEKYDEEGNPTGGYGRKITFADVNNGVWYVANEEVRLKYGIGKAGNKNHYFGFVTFSDETNKERLLARTKEELKKVSRPQAEYTIDVANINIDVNLGDEVPAIDEVLGFRDYLKVVKVEKTKLSTELTFGVMTRAFSSLSDANGESIAEKVTEIVSSRFSEELNRVVNNFNNEDGYNYDLKAGNKYNLPAGYYSFNKPIDENPTKVVYMGAGKVLIADEKGSDGNWKWKTAIDGTGIAGSEILTHSITLNKLAADVGQSLDLSSNRSINATVSNVVKNTLDEDLDLLRQKDKEEILSENMTWTENQIQGFTELTNEALRISAENEEKLKTTDESINSIQDELTSVTQLTSELIQTESEFNIRFSRFEEDIKNNDDRLSEIEVNIRSGVDENNNVYTEWGSSDSESTVRVGNDGIQMLSSNTPTLTLKDGVGEMTSLYVQNELGLGNHKAVKMGTTYTVFVPTGGNE